MTRTANDREQPSKYDLLDKLLTRTKQLREWANGYNAQTLRPVLVPHPMLSCLVMLMDGLIDHIQCPKDRWSPLIKDNKLHIWCPKSPAFVIGFWIDVGGTRVECSIGIDVGVGDDRYTASFEGVTSEVLGNRPESFAEFYQKATHRLQELAIEGLLRSG